MLTRKVSITLLIIFLSLAHSPESRIYRTKQIYNEVQAQVQAEEYEEKTFKAFFTGFKTLVTQKCKAIKKNLGSRYNALKNKLKKRKPKMFKRFWAMGRRYEQVDPEEDSFDVEYMDIPEDEKQLRQVPHVPKALHPGMTAVVELDFIRNVKDMILPEVLGIVFEDPLKLDLHFKRVAVHRLFLDFDELDVAQIQVSLNPVANSVELRFPVVPLSMWTDLTLKLASREVTGRVKGSFHIQSPTVHLLFEEDPANQAFAPMIKLLLDDDFELVSRDFNLQTVFKGIPAWLSDSLVWMLKGQVTKKISGYLRDQFVAGGSTILFYLMEKYYPSNLYLGLGDAFVNLMFLRTPRVRAREVQFDLAGDVFSMKDHPGLSDPDDYQPRGSPESAPLLNARFDKALNVQLSVNFENVRTLLGLIFANLEISVNKKLFGNVHVEKLVFLVPSPEAFSIRNGMFVVQNLAVKFKGKGGKTIVKVTVNMVFRVTILDPEHGKLRLEVKGLFLSLSKKLASVTPNILVGVVKAEVEKILTQHLNGKVVHLSRLKAPLRKGMVVMPLFFVLSDEVINLVSGFRFDDQQLAEGEEVDNQNTNFLAQEIEQMNMIEDESEYVNIIKNEILEENATQIDGQFDSVVISKSGFLSEKKVLI